MSWITSTICAASRRGARLPAEGLASIAELQDDLDNWLLDYNQQRTHSGKYCFRKTPMQTFLDSIPLAKEKMLGSTEQTANETVELSA